MTADQHRHIGTTILGFPPCCVNHWVEHVIFAPGPPQKLGVVVERYRTVGEAFALAAQVSAFLGERWPFHARGHEDYARSVVSDLRKAYVPCPAHSGPHTPGWRA